MTKDARGDWFEGIEEIIADPLRFKAKLRIGEDAYASSRALKAATELWGSAGTAGTAALVVSSAPVASTLFAPAGFLSILGIGTAVTPIGWVVASAVLAGAGWFGVTHFLKQSVGGRSTTIPDFINTPVDVLALALFDLMAPMALKLAAVDGHIDPAEREAINSYFVKEWGFDADFIKEGIAFTESRLPEFSIKDLAQTLAELKKSNKDCNYNEMSREFVAFLREIIEADGRIDQTEEAAIKEVQAVFNDVGQSNLTKATRKITFVISDAAKGSEQTVSQVVKKFSNLNLGFKLGKP